MRRCELPPRPYLHARFQDDVRSRQHPQIRVGLGIQAETPKISKKQKISRERKQKSAEKTFLFQKDCSFEKKTDEKNIIRKNRPK